MRIFQTDAYLVLDLEKRTLNTVRRIGGSDGVPRQLVRDEQQFEAGDALQREIDSFVAAVTGGTTPVVTALDGRRALDAALQISAQLQSWRDDAELAGVS